MNRAVIVDDDELMARTMSDGLEREGMDAEPCFSAADVYARLERGDVDVVVLDVQLPDVNGIEVCREIARRWTSVDVLVMSSLGTVDRAMAAVKAGAHDFLTKPFSANGLAHRLAHLREERRQRQETPPPPLSTGSRELPGGKSPTQLVGASPTMVRVRETVGRIARSSASVLVAGESGTGKEIVARELHRQSRRASGPFVAINCAALPDALLESELFGHVRGAFTDARTDRPGLFAQASGGTIFLDEIGELSPALQPKLLRTLEEHTVRPVGGAREIPIDVRVISATHRNLAADIKSGRFRSDLYYRLDVLRILLPPLRERGDDVVTLARTFAARAARREGKLLVGISEEAEQELRLRRWPGNVRELRNCIEHAVAMTAGDRIELVDLPDAPVPDEVAAEGSGASPGEEAAALQLSPDEDWPTLDELERRYIGRVLSRVAENRSAAARILGIDRRTLMRKLARDATGDDPSSR